MGIILSITAAANYLQPNVSITMREPLEYGYTLNDSDSIIDDLIIDFVKKGYTTTRVNLRKNPEIDDNNIICVYEKNQEIEYEDYNEQWVKVYINKETNEVGYIYSKYISAEIINFTEYALPNNSGFKSYMPYKAITSKNSPQYKLQLNAYTSEDSGIRMVNNRYCVALGSYFNCRIGQEFDLILENGIVIPCIMADEKDDNDTDNLNLFTKNNGCATEFVVDSSKLSSSIKNMGDISYAYEGWDSPVKTIKVYD